MVNHPEWLIVIIVLVMVNHPNMDGFHSRWEYPNSWMVYKGKSQSKMDDDWGYPHFRNLHLDSA